MTEQQTASAAPGAQNSTPRRWYQGFFSHKAPLKDRTEEVCKSESGADDSEFPDGRSADTDLNRVPPPAVPTAASRPIPALPAPLHRQSSSRSGRLSLQFLGRSFSSGTLRREEAAAGTEEEEEELDDRSSTSSERRERRRRQHQADRDDYQSFRRRSIPAAISSSLEEFSRNLTKSRQPSGGTGEGNWTDAREGSGAGEGEPTQQLLDVPALKGTESTEGGSSSLSPSRSPEGREKSPSASLGQAVTQSVQALHERYMHRRSASETFRRMRTGKTDDDAAVSQGSATQMSAPLGRSQDIMQPQQAQSAEQPSIATQQVISERPLETDAQLSRETEVLRANYEGPTHPDPLPASKMPATVTELASRDALPIAAGGALPVSEGGNFPVAVGAVQPEACAARQGPVAPSDLSNDADGQVAGTTVTSQIDAAEPRKRIEGWDEVVIPEVLQAGVPMLKVTHKKVMQRVFRLDSDRGQILWDSKKNNKVNLESIREVRIGSSAASYRTSLSISASHEPRWLSIIYQTGGTYKALHLIALNDNTHKAWRETLEKLDRLRRELMGGLGMLEQRQNVWLRQHWRDADVTKDEKLDFPEVVKLCRRLGIESSRRDLRIRFQEADKSGRGFLDFEDFQRFVRLLKRRTEVEAIFIKWADVTISRAERVPGECDTETPSKEVVNASSTSTGSPRLASTGEAPSTMAGAELRNAQGKVADGPPSVSQKGISMSRFSDFLHLEQKVTSLSDVQLAKLYQKYSDPVASAIVLDGFTAFLMSTDNALLFDLCPLLAQAKPSSEQAASRPSRETAETAEELIGSNMKSSNPSQSPIYHDMTRPMSEYFISSSHNTYLVGNQWKGDSTVEGYVRALQQGARSVELDCWDGPNNTPHITHGRTLTSKVPFADVIAVIARYAFVTSPYPLILSLEVHNEIEQQDVMATILKDTLGDMLLSEKLGERILLDALPSPEDLRGKVLVKAKNLYVAEADKIRAAKEEEAAAAAVVAEAHSTSTDTTESDGDGLLTHARDIVRHVTKRGGGQKESKQQKVLMSAALASLLVYTVGVKCRGLNKKETYAVEHMFSLSEKSAFKYIRQAKEDLIKHNRTHLSRIYPSMSSIARLNASANFLPHHMWAAGCQLVALNWQTFDLGFEINQALFSRNGRCGYVLKPEAFRIKEAIKDSGDKLRFVIDVTIVSAQQLPRFKDMSREKENVDDSDVIDPFVAVSIHTPDSWGNQPGSFDASKSVFASAANKKDSSGTVSCSPSDRPPIAIGGSPRRSSTFLGNVSSLPSAAGPSSPPTLARTFSNSSGTSGSSSLASRTARLRTRTIKGNGFNPIWDQKLSIALEVPAGVGAAQLAAENAKAQVQAHETSNEKEGHKDPAACWRALDRGLLDLCFLRFEVCEEDGSDSNCLAAYTICLGSLQQGYRHVPLYDSQLSQYLFSTLFVHTSLRFVGIVGGGGAKT